MKVEVIIEKDVGLYDVVEKEVKIYNVVLERLSSENNNLRTNRIVGVTARFPEVGRSFVMFADALDPTQGDTRIVSTSVVKLTYNDVKAGTWRFATLNSTYDLHVLPDDPA